ncbi:MAG: hypothetical protein GY861_21395 [bacterium]|nr:hypothetical protein [bacterium]
MSNAEISYALIGKILGPIAAGFLQYKTVGSESSVDVDYNSAMHREDAVGDVIGFYHTHIVKSTSPSDRDISFYRAWCHCFNKPLLCLISSSDRLFVRAFIFKYPCIGYGELYPVYVKHRAFLVWLSEPKRRTIGGEDQCCMALS